MMRDAAVVPVWRVAPAHLEPTSMERNVLTRRANATKLAPQLAVRLCRAQGWCSTCYTYYTSSYFSCTRLWRHSRRVWSIHGLY